MMKHTCRLCAAASFVLSTCVSVHAQSARQPDPTGGVSVPEVKVQQPKPDPDAVAPPPRPRPTKAPVEVVSAPPKPKPVPKTVEPVVTSPSSSPYIAPDALPPLNDPSAAKALIAPSVSAPLFGAPISGPTVNSTDRATTETRPVFRVGDILDEVPGISVKQGNGPRDIGVSIRGSNAQNGFGVRNIVVFEDGFPVTQPDGLSRTDLTDPHAYAGADVFRGPSSSLFGNFATGGAINYRTRPGGEINGVEYGIDVGSFGYVNTYLTGGAKVGNAEFSIFASDVRGDGYLGNADFNTQTVNALLNVKLTEKDTLTFKVINNELFTHLPVRQSLNQFFANPYDRGCQTAATAAPGCGTISVFANGFGGTRIPLTAAQAGLGRDDTRNILGARWEHDFDPLTVWRTQVVWDDRNINQPTGATSAIGDFASWNLSTDLTRRTGLFGLEATHYIGVFYNFLPVHNSNTYNVVAGGNATLGSETQNQQGVTSNLGFRLREELKLAPQWTLAAGVASETTHLQGINTAFSYPAGPIPTVSHILTDRDFHNVAPEVSLTYHPDETLQVRGRFSTGYGTPQFTNLFVTPAGVAGNNTQLQPQTNIGYDLGAVWAPNKSFKIDVTGFYEFFQNELISQSPGAGLLSYTFNAPASEHRGIEIASTVKPLTGVTWTTAYLYDDQIYTEYNEQISSGAKTANFNRAGNKLPGVAPNELTTRLAYDHPEGVFKGFGTFAEYQWRDAFFIDNANLLRAPGAETVNLNVHYKTALSTGPVRELLAYFEVHNLFDRANIASANNVTDSLNTTTGAPNPGSVLANTATGSIYAAEPRTYYGGVKLKF